MNRILELHQQGRIIRGEWSGTDDQGREQLCLYTALAGSADARPASCPGYIMPQWVAYLLPWLDDAGSEAKWDSMVRRVAALAPHMHRLLPAAEWRAKALCMREAMRHTTDPTALAVRERVAALCDRAAKGEDVTAEMAEADAWAGAAARSVQTTAAEAAARAAEAAVSEAAWAAGAAAAWAAARATADRLAAAILTDWETELQGGAA